MKLKTIGFFVLGVACVVYVAVVHDAVGQECVYAEWGCPGSCSIPGCDCYPAPTSLPTSSGCGEAIYYEVSGNCGTCIASTPLGDVPCFQNCGNAKAVEDYMCYP